ncbi:glycosyl transferase [Taibaiella sp. KBW10]|uniref:glycosyltransferase family 2 protein n=1 Tax=Taibaiella sp. KBW10 TaxID=2153357 RepID=UPI000F59E961|nr:glycosyltransferase [Taibaiella sp. KBW10]RQO29900.1 glycosyl transferase [Taibaiella sp. KBW10]
MHKNKEKISIITAIHNGFASNEIFLDTLKKYTHHTFELIIIDNASTDGSAELFEKNGALVIRNKENYSYPYTQNQGIKVAQGAYIFFLNNDIFVGPDWDKILIDAARANDIDVISAKGLENMGNVRDTKAIALRWKRIKYPLLMMGSGVRILRLMHRLMYGNWQKFCARQFDTFGLQTIEGIVGNNVMMTRNALDKVGVWDETQQAADFDVFMRVKKRSIEHQDIKPCQIALGAYIHHYVRMTLKYGSHKPVPFADIENLRSISQKWTPEEVNALHPDKVIKG